MRAFGTPKQRVKSAAEAMRDARNVYCVGRNYRDHALELGNEVPASPLVFGKFTHALTPAEGTWVLPEGRTVIHHELEVVLWFDAPYTPGVDWKSLIGGVALGIDWTDREAQNQLKAKGQPWEFAKSFRGSAVVTDFWRVVDWEALLETPFALRRNGQTVQQGRLADVLFPLSTLVEFVGTHFGIDRGDVLFTGTPEGVGPVASGDELHLMFDTECWGMLRIERR